MSRTLQFKRYPATVVANTTGANGELIINTTNFSLTVHDGTTLGGHIVSASATDTTARSTANAAFIQANSAFIQANSAFVQANTPSSVANSAASFANGAFGVANTAASFANGAFGVANTAASFANGAFVVANSAASFANGAFVQANAAFAAANTGAPDAFARSTANAAFVQANTPSSIANSAASFANGAFVKANSVYLPSVTRLDVTSSGSSAFLIDQYTGNNPELYIRAGETLAFNLSVTGHPFLIRVSNAGAQYNTGLIHVTTTGTVTTDSSAQGQVTGTLYWKVPNELAGNTYVYQCQVHGGMVGNIVIERPNQSNSAASFANGAFLQANSAASFANGAFTAANTAANTGTSAASFANGAFLQANAAFLQANTPTSPAITTSITTPNTTFALINTTATTVNFAGAATTALNIGANNAPITGFAATANTSSTASSLGYLGIPQNATGSATLTITDAGKHIYVTTAGQTITIPANASVAYPIGTTIGFIAGPGATTVVISINSDTMYLGGTGTTGSRTLAAHGMATAVKVAATTWYISGNGLT